MTENMKNFLAKVSEDKALAEKIGKLDKAALIALAKEMGFELESYDNVYVMAESVDAVEGVIEQLNDYGVQYSSPMEMVALMKEQISII